MRLKWGFTSYFGSVLALAWSPDSKIIAAGGQDDLVAMASAVHQSVMCWGEGHRRVSTFIEIYGTELRNCLYRTRNFAIASATRLTPQVVGGGNRV